MPALPLNVDLHIYLLGRFVRVLVLFASQVIPCLVKAPLKGTFSSKSKPLLTCNAVYPSRRFGENGFRDVCPLSNVMGLDGTRLVVLKGPTNMFLNRSLFSEIMTWLLKIINRPLFE